MDLDIEMDVDGDDTRDVQQIPEAYTHDIITGEEQEPGEVDEPIGDEDDSVKTNKIVVPYKVHISGLETFNPDDVKAYLQQHYSVGQFDRIEWVDDSSANLVFKSESAAQEALIALAALTVTDPTQLPPLEAIPAKPYASKPDCALQVRFAVTGDKKAVGAAQRSRFYLLHPEYDPEERRRRSDFSRGKYRDRDNSYRRDRRDGRDGRDRRQNDRRDDDEEPETFDVNFYDDDPAALAQRTFGRRPRSRRDSRSSRSVSADRDRSYSRRNRDKELFPDRRSGSDYRARARSASPARDRDGDARMADEDARNAAMLRDREKGRSIRERQSRDTSGRDNNTRELFPGKTNGVRELFPSKVVSGAVGSKAQMDQVDDTTILTSAKLADRITARPAASGGLNIRGLAAKRASEQGLAIKGTGATVKELFPERFGSNAGKELFAEKIEGRGRRRQRAEDLFY